MDEQRGIREVGNLSRFFDKTPARLGLALNQPADRLYRRTERIVAALFLATNHIPTSESLRGQVREEGLKILQYGLALRDELRASQSVNVSNFRASARYLISLLRMLTIGGFLSIQNASVLVEALDELGSFLVTAQQSSLSDTISFSKQELLDTQTAPVKDKEVIKDKSSIKDIANPSDKKRDTGLDVRKQNIIEILRTGGELGIVDIASNLPEYSTKMIQRDLAELASTGKVKKMGEKRWSRYSIA
jgi:hypothetical protein